MAAESGTERWDVEVRGLSREDLRSLLEHCAGSLRGGSLRPAPDVQSWCPRTQPRKDADRRGDHTEATPRSPTQDTEEDRHKHPYWRNGKTVLQPCCNRSRTESNTTGFADELKCHKPLR